MQIRTYMIVAVVSLLQFRPVCALADSITVSDVRVIYLIPSDRTYNAAYDEAITSAIRNLQAWYADQLGGHTYVLSTSIVQPITTSHTAAYYSTHPNGDSALWFWNNATADAFALTGGSFYDPNHIWAIYIDALPASGQITGGCCSVALLPEHDLLGVAGLEPEPVNRWIGGLGHELGHAFGLPHPPGCDSGPPPCQNPDSLMWLGYLTYPNTYLRDADKSTLLASPFFATTSVPEPSSIVLLGYALTGGTIWIRIRRRNDRRKVVNRFSIRLRPRLHAWAASSGKGSPAHPPPDSLPGEVLS